MMRGTAVLYARVPKQAFAPTPLWAHEARWWELKAEYPGNQDPMRDTHIDSIPAGSQALTPSNFYADQPFTMPPVRPERTKAEAEVIKKRLGKVTWVSSKEFALQAVKRSNKFEVQVTNDMKLEAQQALLDQTRQATFQREYPFDALGHHAGLADLCQPMWQYNTQINKNTEILGRRHCFAEFNAIYFLPQRERTAVRIIGEVTNELTGKIRAGYRWGVEDWLPEQFRFIPARDPMRHLANRPEHRKQVLDMVNEEGMVKAFTENVTDPVKLKMKEMEAKGVAASMRRGIDPTHHITDSAIANEKDDKKLREYFHAVSDYCWDGRVQKILTRAAEVTGDQQAKQNLDVGLFRDPRTPELSNGSGSKPISSPKEE